MSDIHIEIESLEVILYSKEGGRIKNLGRYDSGEDIKRIVQRAIEFGKHLKEKQLRHTLGIFP